jgi:hypothetical protein
MRRVRSQPHTDGELAPLVGRVQVGERSERVVEAHERLAARTARPRLEAGAREVVARFRPRAGLMVVSADGGAVRVEIVSVRGFERAGDLSVQQDAPRPQQAAVRDLAHPVVGEVEAPADLAEDASPHQLLDPVRDLGLREA